MSNISGLGYGLMDLSALKKLSEQQNVNGEKGNKKEQEISNVFEKIGGLGSEGTSPVIGGRDIPEITDEDLKALENAEEEQEIQNGSEVSTLQALAETLKEFVSSLLPNKGGKGTPATTVLNTEPASLGLTKDTNSLFIKDDATVSELQQIKQETLNKYNNEISSKKAEQEQFIAQQENKKSNINSQINQQKAEINDTKNEISNINSQISNTESKISATESQISSLKSELGSIDSEDEDAAAKKSAIEAKIQNLEAKKSELEAKKNDLNAKKTNLEQDLSSAEQELSNIEKELQNVEIETNNNKQIFEQEISSLENYKNSEISKIDLKIAQTKANENQTKTNKEKPEEEKRNIFAGV